MQYCGAEGFMLRKLIAIGLLVTLGVSTSTVAVAGGRGFTRRSFLRAMASAGDGRAQQGVASRCSGGGDRSGQYRSASGNTRSPWRVSLRGKRRTVRRPRVSPRTAHSPHTASSEDRRQSQRYRARRTGSYRNDFVDRRPGRPSTLVVRNSQATQTITVTMGTDPPRIIELRPGHMPAATFSVRHLPKLPSFRRSRRSDANDEGSTPEGDEESSAGDASGADAWRLHGDPLEFLGHAAASVLSADERIRMYHIIANARRDPDGVVHREVALSPVGPRFTEALHTPLLGASVVYVSDRLSERIELRDRRGTLPSLGLRRRHLRGRFPPPYSEPHEKADNSVYRLARKHRT